MNQEGESKNAPMVLTEDEGALYDRQIRLWGLEAQEKMRNATILVVKLKGVATEVIKNIVLAGIGKLIIADDEDVSEEDLGAGFFFRDADVGKKRVDAAKYHIENLNPLVKVEVMSQTLDSSTWEVLVKKVDLVCVTDWTREKIIQINQTCRAAGKPLYAGGSYGLSGYIFCDLLNHEYIAPDRSGKDGAKSLKMTASYTPLHEALQHSWKSFSKRQTKDTNPAVIFALLALWEFESRHGSLPETLEESTELESLSDHLIEKAAVNKQAFSGSSTELFQSLSTTAAHEFSPVCAIIGGMLAQDILKTLSAREAPIANLFAFDGSTGAGHVTRLMDEAVVKPPTA